MTFPATLILAVLAAALSGAAQAAEPPSTEPGPVAYTGHGAVFAPGGREITVTADFIRSAQAYYAARIGSDASPRLRALFDHKSRYLADLTRGDERAALAAQAALLDWYIARARPVDAQTLARKNQILRGAGVLRNYSLPPDLQAMLALAGVGGKDGVGASGRPAIAAAAPAAPSPRETYIKGCRDAGVPVPDSYQLSGNGWTDNGDLDTLFIGPGDKAKVAFRANQGSEPEGVCIALPRYESGKTDTVALGLICMGSATSRSCYFDDKTPKALAAMRPLTDFKSGAELDAPGQDVCTDCHAGENAFVIHPKAAAFKNIPNLQPKAWHVPMVSKNWPQNPGPGTINRKCSTACHKQGDAGRFPALSTDLPGFCGTILESAVRDTMSAYSNLAYTDQIKAMRDACKKPPPPKP